MTKRDTYLLLPSGEWLEALLTVFSVAGLKFENTDPRSYQYRCSSIPLIMILVRSRDVPACIYDPETIVKGGFTGSDIAKDQQVNFSWKVPLEELKPPGANFPKPEVYLGVTPNLTQRTPKPTINDIRGGTIYTSYPGITAQYLKERGIDAKIKIRQGKIEGMWQIDPENTAIVDISSSGATCKANNIQKIDSIMRSELVFIESPKIKKSDSERIADLREEIYQATKK